MPGGRPKDTLDSLGKGWELKILNLYENGASDVEIKAFIWKKRKAFSNSLWNRWMDEEEEFSTTIKMGRELSRCWWENMGRTQLMVDNDAPKLNATLWYMNMKNRFGWADRQESTISGPNGEPIKTDNKFTVEFVNADSKDK